MLGEKNFCRTFPHTTEILCSSLGRLQAPLSKHALRLIRNFLLTQMPESVEADVEDSDTEKKIEPLAKVFSPWASLDSIKAMLWEENATESGQKKRNHAAMAAARRLTHLLWRGDDDASEENSFLLSQEGHVGSYTKSESFAEASARKRVPR